VAGYPPFSAAIVRPSSGRRTRRFFVLFSVFFALIAFSRRHDFCWCVRFPFFNEIDFFFFFRPKCGVDPPLEGSPAVSFPKAHNGPSFSPSAVNVTPYLVTGRSGPPPPGTTTAPRSSPLSGAGPFFLPPSTATTVESSSCFFLRTATLLSHGCEWGRQLFFPVCAKLSRFVFSPFSSTEHSALMFFGFDSLFFFSDSPVSESPPSAFSVCHFFPTNRTERRRPFFSPTLFVLVVIPGMTPLRGFFPSENQTSFSFSRECRLFPFFPSLTSRHPFFLPF